MKLTCKSKTGSKEAYAGQTVYYNYQIRNLGPDTARNVAVIDSILGSVYGPQDLTAGASESFTITYKIQDSDPDPLINKAIITSDTLDSNPENNEDTWTIQRAKPMPVGGIITPTNKLKILVPCLALAGLIIVASTVHIIKKGKD